MRGILVAIFLILNLLVFIVTEYNITHRINASLYTHLNNLKIHYDVFMKTQKDIADIVYDMTIKNKKFISNISKASQTKDKELIDELRNNLTKELQESYKLINKKGILQFHIIFPNNVTFLRMHKLHKFNDDLTKVRWDFVKVNETCKAVRGFAQGKTSHAFRNVYPLLDESHQHIGAMEVSFPSEVLQKSLNNISQIHSHFLVKKSVFQSKAWYRDDLILKYVPSLEHKDFFMTLSKIHKQHTDKEIITEGIAKIKDKIASNMSKEKEFSLLLRHNDNLRIASFLPITQNVTKEIVAWIVSYDHDEFVETSLRDMVIIRVLSFFILAILVYFVYRIVIQKKHLKNLLESYDKNVIASRTDINGKYTYVSKAFCKITGYTKEELLGKKSIIKASLTKKEFSDIARYVENKNIWKGEVQDKNKNGDFYWVHLEIEPILHKDKVIGYSSIRHDISDRKDIEKIQKEIIFTMGSIGESRSKETANHVKRVALYSKILAKHYGLDKESIDILEQASPMHDIGKVAISDAILTKPGKLNKQERIIIETHSFKGYSMLKHSNRKLLQAAAIVAYEHHEKWDGTGYPRGLKEHDIHIYGRITALADVFDALGSKRCYKEAWPDDRVFTFLKEERGKHFDPKLVDIFFKHIDEFLKVRESLQD